MKKQIYIVDYIGIHSGMHYYNSSFKSYLEEIDGLNVDVISNYKDKGKVFFYNVYVVNKIFGFFLFLINYFRLLFKVINSKNEYFILLSYGNIVDVIFMTITIFSKRIIIDVHEVCELQLKSKIVKFMLTTLYKKSVKTLIYHSERSNELLSEIGYNKKRIYVPHFKYQFNKAFDEAKIGNDVIRNISKNKINILFFGYVTYAKGIDILLRATNLLPENIVNKLNIIIAGKDFDGTINTVDTKYDFSIKRILRHINDDELIYIFSHIDYVILPYRKTSQSGILEMAFYFKKPIIATCIKYFERLLTQFPSFGLLMQVNERSMADVLIEVVNTHENNYTNYFTEYDLYNFNSKVEIEAFIQNVREIINT